MRPVGTRAGELPTPALSLICPGVAREICPLPLATGMRREGLALPFTEHSKRRACPTPRLGRASGAGPCGVSVGEQDPRVGEQGN